MFMRVATVNPKKGIKYMEKYNSQTTPIDGGTDNGLHLKHAIEVTVLSDGKKNLFNIDFLD